MRHQTDMIQQLAGNRDGPDEVLRSNTAEILNRVNALETAGARTTKGGGKGGKSEKQRQRRRQSEKHKPSATLAILRSRKRAGALCAECEKTPGRQRTMARLMTMALARRLLAEQTEMIIVSRG